MVIKYSMSGDCGSVYSISGDCGSVYSMSGDCGSVYSMSGDCGSVYSMSGDCGSVSGVLVCWSLDLGLTPGESLACIYVDIKLNTSLPG